MATELLSEDSFAFEIHTHFCANTACELHVRAGDVGVKGQGNWAELRDGGLLIGRRLVAGRMVCDLCATNANTPGGWT